MRIRFHSNDDLPLSKILSISVLSIVVKSVLQNENKYYPQIRIHECDYECEYELKKISIAFFYFLETFYETKYQYSSFFLSI